MPDMWKQKDGTEIAVTNMTDQHLGNAIRMLERTAPALQIAESAAAWSALSSLQGEQAIYAAEEACDSLDAMTPEEWLEEYEPYMMLIRERDRRAGVQHAEDKDEWDPVHSPEEAEAQICYIMDGYYAGGEKPVIDFIEKLIAELEYLRNDRLKMSPAELEYSFIRAGQREA